MCLNKLFYWHLCCFQAKGVVWEWDDTMSYSNDCGKLSFHKESLKGKVQDYVIEFAEEMVDIPSILEGAYDLFLQLMEKFQDKTVLARLVAKVMFQRVGQEGEVEEEAYHFGSVTQEVVNPRDFFVNHMMIISSRLVDVNKYGSNWVMKTISHLHVNLSCIDRP